MVINEHPVRFRTARNQDTEGIIALVKGILPEFNLTYSPESSEQDLQNIEKSYMKNGGTFEVIENEKGVIIGTIALLNLGSGRGKIRKMYVMKNYRKSRLGTLLLKRTLSVAKELGFTEVFLETVHSMTAAIHLYEKYGFKRVNGHQATSPRCDLVMSKKLNDEAAER